MTQRWFQRVEGEAEPVVTAEDRLANDLAVLRGKWRARQETVTEALGELQAARFEYSVAGWQESDELPTDWQHLSQVLDEAMRRAILALRRVPL